MALDNSFPISTLYEWSVLFNLIHPLKLWITCRHPLSEKWLKEPSASWKLCTSLLLHWIMYMLFNVQRHLCVSAEDVYPLVSPQDSKSRAGAVPESSLYLLPIHAHHSWETHFTSAPKEARPELYMQTLWRRAYDDSITYMRKTHRLKPRYIQASYFQRIT